MPEPFTIHVPQSVLDDLHERLVRTRWPDAVAGDWDRGTEPGYLKALIGHWRDGYDWRATERRLNALDHFTTTVDGVGLHYLTAGRDVPESMPLLLLHGWPDSFLRFEKVLPLLTADEGSFQLVVPSIPGYGFSQRPTEAGTDAPRIADLFAGLMRELGFDRFGVHGGDIGSGIAEQLAIRHPDRLIGLHLTDVPWWHVFAVDRDDLSAAEQSYLDEGTAWSQSEGAYALQQSTKPQTLAYSLNDSPVGLAAWFVEKFRAWSDCDGDISSRFTFDELLTNLTLYWVTETAGSAARLYYENAHADRGGRTTPPAVPTGVAVFPRDIVPAPREFAERWFDLRRWTEMPRGGHFAALEEPGLLADDLRAFFRPLRSDR
jgi:pimeloyl-ACP methyl ester carboxylesterase